MHLNCPLLLRKCMITPVCNQVPVIAQASFISCLQDRQLSRTIIRQKHSTLFGSIEKHSVYPRIDHIFSPQVDKPPDSSSLLPLTVLLSYCSAVTAFYLWSNQPVFHEVMFGVICVVLTLLDLKQVVCHKEIFSKRRSLQINEYVFPGPQAPEGS